MNTLAGNKSEGEGSYVTFRKLKCRILLPLSFVLISSFSFIYFDFVAFRRIPKSTEIPTCTREVTLKPNRSSSSSSSWYGEALPSCAELMRQPMYADGSFLTNRNTTQIVWRKRHDGSKELTVPFTCYLTRYTPEQAGKCLKNKNLFFVGDSLTRYQFLSLAYFLEYKKWPMRFHAGLQPCLDHIDENGNPTCSKKEEPNVCSERDWVDIGGWKSYYQAMGGGTDGSMFHGRMESQSVRSGISVKRNPVVDTMQYTSSEEYGEGNGRTKLSAYMELGTSGMEPFHGFNFTGCGYNATCTYTPERYAQNEKRVSNSDFDWEYPNIVTGFGSNGTSFHAQHQDTNYVFYNRGLWGGIQIDKAEKMMSAMYEMTGGDEGRRVSNNRCFFRSTTANFRTNSALKDLESGPVRDIVRRSGCEYFDIAFVTEEFSRIEDSYERRSTFWDQLHYTPWVYEELNNLLLNVLCNTQDF